MSVLGGIASTVGKVLGGANAIGGLAKGAWNIGKKVVGGITGLFKKGGSGSKAVSSAQNAVQSGQQIYNQGKQIYDGFKQGGFSGGIQSAQQNLPGMMQSGQQMFNSGREAFNSGRDTYNQGRSMVQGGINQGRNMMQGARFLGGQGGGMQGLMRRPKLPQWMAY